MVTIVTDSSVDLPPAEAERLGIVIAPLSVAFPDENRHDEGLSRPDFYRRLEAAPRPPTVAGASAEAFEAALKRAQGRGPEIVCMVMSIDSTFTRVAAEVAARRLPDAQVSIISTGRSLAAQAAIAILAAEAAAVGRSRAEVVRLIEDVSAAADTYLVPATGEYLRRADRLTTLGQGPAGRLEGMIPVLRARGRLTAVAKAADAVTARAMMLDLIARTADPARAHVVVVTHAVAPVVAAQVAADLAARMTCRPPLITELGPTVGAALGPGAVGVGYCPVPIDA